MIPVVLCIDVEPDPREPAPDAPAPWDGWEICHARFAALRAEIAAVTGRPAAFNWFLRFDPQIAALHGAAGYIAERDRSRFAALAAAGDELGLHPHLFRLDAAGRWIIEFADWPWIRTVLRSARDGFRAAFGRAPWSIRIGDGWMSDAAMAELAALGFRHDLTLEPGRRQESWAGALGAARGRFPATEAVPRFPYRPARRDYTRPGRLWPRPIWILPLSTAPSPQTDGIVDYEAINFVLPWGESDLDRALGERPAPCLLPVLRAGDLATPRYRATFERNIERLLAHPRARDFAFVTPAAFVAWNRASGGSGGARPV